MSYAPTWKHYVGVLDHRPSAPRVRSIQISKPLEAFGEPQMFLSLKTPFFHLDYTEAMSCPQHQAGAKRGHHCSENSLTTKTPLAPQRCFAPDVNLFSDEHCRTHFLTSQKMVCEQQLVLAFTPSSILGLHRSLRL